MKTLKRTFVREGKPIFFGIAIFAGVYALLKILEQSWQAMPASPLLLAVVVMALVLPKVFSRLKTSRDPYTVQFAEAFREGFMSLSFVASNISSLATKARGLFRSLLPK